MHKVSLFVTAKVVVSVDTGQGILRADFGLGNAGKWKDLCGIGSRVALKVAVEVCQVVFFGGV